MRRSGHFLRNYVWRLVDAEFSEVVEACNSRGHCAHSSGCYGRLWRKQYGEHHEGGMGAGVGLSEGTGDELGQAYHDQLLGQYLSCMQAAGCRHVLKRRGRCVRKPEAGTRQEQRVEQQTLSELPVP